MSKADDDLLEEIRERFSFASTYWHDVRDEGDTDMRFVAGDPWSEADRQAREKAKRPCLSLDELGQYFNQVINDVLANPRGAKFSPNGNGATDATATFYADKWRETEYRSKAQIAYTTAFQNTIQRSYGACRLTTRYASERSADQELWIEDIPNPNMLLVDPEAMSPTSSDMKWCFFFEAHRVKDFPKEYPKATITSFSTELMRIASEWIKGDTIVIAEYWKVKTKADHLFILKPTPAPAVPGRVLQTGAAPPAQPRAVFKSELSKEAVAGLRSEDILHERDVKRPSVCSYLTNGVEILERTEWAGKYIPFATCYGQVIYVVDGGVTKRKILSMTRLARDPAMLYCYYRTKQAEIAKMVPLAPVMGAKGQFRNVEGDWTRMSDEPVPYVEYNPTTEATGAQILPPPMRLPYEAGAHLQSLELCAEGARRAIQASIGQSPLPTMAQRRNEKSGVALKQIDDSAQRGSFHYIDHYNGMIEQMAVIGEDLIDKIYDAPREVSTRKPNGSTTSVRINDPDAPGPNGQPRELSTKGDHLVTISTGPKVDSEREAGSDFADQILSMPQLAQVVGPQKYQKLLALGVKLKNIGTVGDEVVEILDPPTGTDGQPNPQQMQQENAQLKQQLEQVTQAAGQMKQAIDTDQAKQAGAVRIAELTAASREKIAEEDRAARIEIARISAAKQSADLEREAAEEALALADEHVQQATQADAQHQHEVELANLKASHARELAAQSHQQGLEAAAQGHQQTLEQGQQAADLAPEPDAAE